MFWERAGSNKHKVFTLLWVFPSSEVSRGNFLFHSDVFCSEKLKNVSSASVENHKYNGSLSAWTVKLLNVTLDTFWALAFYCYFLETPERSHSPVLLAMYVNTMTVPTSEIYCPQHNLCLSSLQSYMFKDQNLIWSKQLDAWEINMLFSFISEESISVSTGN